MNMNRYTNVAYTTYCGTHTHRHTMHKQFIVAAFVRVINLLFNTIAYELLRYRSENDMQPVATAVRRAMPHVASGGQLKISILSIYN